MKRIVFLTGTRADFGKLKSLIDVCDSSPLFDVHIFVTGMHMQSQYGSTVDEILKYGYKNVYQFINGANERRMDQILAKTIEGFSDYIRELKPDLVLVHGDRVEALAGATAGSLNNILVAHVEGGEVSGTIDELIRHAVTKMSHMHFVSNDEAKRRIIQLGELEASTFVIGSPDVDLMFSDKLPSLEEAKDHYEIDFEDYGILMFHPVTTEYEKMGEYAKHLVSAVMKSDQNFVVIYPNNDLGSADIFREYKALDGRPNVRLFPSLRFEYFLTMLRNSKFILGNSSAGIMEAPCYGVPSINVGSRQNNRSRNTDLIHCEHDVESILNALSFASDLKIKPRLLFGEGDSSEKFINVISQPGFWEIEKQKLFKDLY